MPDQPILIGSEWRNSPETEVRSLSSEAYRRESYGIYVICSSGKVVGWKLTRILKLATHKIKLKNKNI
jgi:hypothetical protein